MQFASDGPTLLGELTARQGSMSRRAVEAASVLFLAALTAAAAQISVPLPFSQVPLTFQPMVVLLGGLALGSRLGMAAQLAYLAAGIAGLPVFALSDVLPQGALRLLGPTGGYLMSYPAAAFLTGLLAERGYDRRYLTAVAAMLAGLLVVYAVGAFWLGSAGSRLTLGAPIGLRTAVITGVLPFAAADLIKLCIAAAIVPAIWKLVGRTSQ